MLRYKKIIDTTFIIAFHPKYDNLLKTPNEFANTGIQLPGIDMRLKLKK